MKNNTTLILLLIIRLLHNITINYYSLNPSFVFVSSFTSNYNPRISPCHSPSHHHHHRLSLVSFQTNGNHNNRKNLFHLHTKLYDSPPPPSSSSSTLVDTVGLITTKFLDTIEDIVLHVQRLFQDIYTSSSSTSQQQQDTKPMVNILDEWNNNVQNDTTTQYYKPRLLVVGSGWSSHAFMKVIDTNLYRVLLVSPCNYFCFTPMLPSSSVGTIEFKSIVESIRHANPSVSFLEGKVIDIQLDKQTATILMGGEDQININTLPEEEEEAEVLMMGGVQRQQQEEEEEKRTIEIAFDSIVYGVGVAPYSFGTMARTPGLSSQNVYFLKSVLDAKKLRTGVIDLLEKASRPTWTEEQRRQLLTFIIVGGGPTGVEYCGELIDFLDDITGRKTKSFRSSIPPFVNLANYTRVILLQGANELLLQFDPGLRIKARKALEMEGIQVITNAKVSKIDGPDKIMVLLGNTQVEETLHCGLIVWAAGTAPRPLTEKILKKLDSNWLRMGNQSSSTRNENITSPIQLSKGGRLPVDSWLRVIGTKPGTFLAMGDASLIVDGKDALPQTAQVAAQQGAYAARLFNRGYNLTSLDNDQPPINSAAADGDILTWLRLRGAVDASPFSFLNLGQLAFLGGGEALSQLQIGDQPILYEAGSIGFLLWRSVYIVKQVSTRTRLLVLFDWFKSKLFGRDVTRM